DDLAQMSLGAPQTLDDLGVGSMKAGFCHSLTLSPGRGYCNLTSGGGDVMLYLIVKALPSRGLSATVSDIPPRSPPFRALVASLPLVPIIAGFSCLAGPPPAGPGTPHL